MKSPASSLADAVDNGGLRGMLAALFISIFILWLIVALIFIYVTIFMVNITLGWFSILSGMILLYMMATKNTRKDVAK